MYNCPPESSLTSVLDQLTTKTLGGPCRPSVGQLTTNMSHRSADHHCSDSFSMTINSTDHQHTCKFLSDYQLLSGPFIGRNPAERVCSKTAIFSLFRGLRPDNARVFSILSHYSLTDTEQLIVVDFIASAAVPTTDRVVNSTMISPPTFLTVLPTNGAAVKPLY
ncbi:hypothetical protein RRG08_063633 [Elysia crispata]|uniref:Uncharacterized protein n=1 Tax=Elysia crispata TaxID=231223 RepID=A0AAE1E0A2_9GAST|nr:hypothetical protein RRG08_063633 [Elysia crispata]